jgi:small nuclear ribonucleoprotein (snRNP)-like protein
MYEDEDEDEDDYDYDDYSDYDINIKKFNGKKVFGSSVDSDQIYELVYDLVENTMYLEDADGFSEIEDFSMDLIISFDYLVDELRECGYKSAEDFRRAGKKFYPSTDYGQRILIGFRRASQKADFPISKDLKNFILGMKLGD